METATEATLYDGTIVPAGTEVRELHDGRWALLDDDNIVELHDGEFAPEDEATCLHNGDWALNGDCRVCSGNSEYYLHDELTRWHGGYFCDDYLSDHTFICDNCGERYDNDDYGSDGNCEDCERNRDPDDEEDGLADYSCTAANCMTPEGKGPLYFGIELEVESKPSYGRGDAVSRAYSLLGSNYIVCKSDGSLDGERGFEIVTRPDSREVHEKKWDEYLAQAGNSVTSWQSGRCGMHIHASRSALTQLQLGKMLVLVNHENNQEMVTRVAGRNCHQWSSFEKKKLSDGKRLSDNRYVALNVKTETVECRIFRGTIKKESFMKNLEFYDAVIAFCAPAEHGTGDVETPHKFLSFVDRNRKRYPHLHAFFVCRGIYLGHGIRVKLAPQKVITQ
jgi:hypothetical protein